MHFTGKNMADDELARNKMVRKTGRLAVSTITGGSHVVVGSNRGELERLLH